MQAGDIAIRRSWDPIVSEPSLRGWPLAKGNELTLSTKVILTRERQTAPMFERLPIFWERKTYNEGLSPIFQSRPSPKVDLAWRRIANVSGVRVNAEELGGIGYDPETVWPWPGEDDAYYAIPEVFHQAHCIDSLRQAAWPEYYGNIRQSYSNDTIAEFERHLLHCQYVLLKAITCNADLSLVTFHKVKDREGPNPVYSTSLAGELPTARRCKNWDAIWEWKVSHQLVIVDEATFKKTPAGIVEVEENPILS
jgi:hypothetical protein